MRRGAVASHGFANRLGFGRFRSLLHGRSSALLFTCSEHLAALWKLYRTLCELGVDDIAHCATLTVSETNTNHPKI
jgi:hypothetical protein